MMLVYLIPIIADIWLWYALVKDLRQRSLVLKVIVVTVMAALTVVLLFLVLRISTYGGDFAAPANAYRYIVLALTGMLLVTAGLVYLFIRFFSRLAGKVLHRDMNRAGLFNIIIFLLLVILIADGHFRQRFDVRMVRQDIAVRGLDPALSGMKIVFISDLHLSSYYGNYDHLEDVVTLINREEPDLLINTGDFVSYGWQEFGGCDTILGKAHARYGAFAVVGNHDDGTYYPAYDKHYGDECTEMIAGSIARSGYLLLSDTSVTVTRDSARVAIAGIVTHGHHLDMSYGDFSGTLGQIPDSLFTILLLHDPAGWDQALAGARQPDLTLAGHTHGMQLGLPGGHLSPAVWIHKRWKGLYRHDNKYLYVTSGLGTMGMAVRIFMPPEIVVITITRD